MSLIDAPSPFAPVEDWKRFVAELEQLLQQDPGDAQLKQELARARERVRAAE